MSTASQLNRQKIGKWIWQLMVHFQGTVGLRAQLLRDRAGTVTARIFTQRRGPEMTLVADAAGAVVHGRETVEIERFVDRELRTHEVLPWLEDRVRSWLAPYPRRTKTDLARTYTLHAIGLVLANEANVTAEQLKSSTAPESWTWQLAFAGDDDSVATKVGCAVFLEDGVAVNDRGDVLDLALLFNAGLPGKEIEARLRALVRGENAATSGDALLARHDEEARRIIFSPVREDDVVLGTPWRRSEFLHQRVTPLAMTGGSAGFWSGDGRVALVANTGQLLSWPPAATSPVIERPALAGDMLNGSYAASIAAGMNAIAWVNEEGRLHIVRGAPPMNGGAWDGAERTPVEIKGSTGILTWIEVSGDGEELAAVDAGTGAHFGLTSERHLRSTYGTSPGGHPLSGAFAPSRGLLASLGRAVELFDLRSGRRVAKTREDDVLGSKIYGAFDATERLLVLVYRDMVVVVDVDTTRAWPLFPIHRKMMTDFSAQVPVVFSRSGEFLAVGGERVTIHRWRSILPLLERMPRLNWAPLG